MMKKHKEERQKDKKSIFLFLLLGGVGFASVSGGLVARYVSQNKNQAEMIASGFYISSNYLEDETGDAIATNYVSDWGTHGIDIVLYNYEKENAALIAEDDITYQVSTDGSGWNISVKNVDNSKAALIDGNYVFPSDGETRQSQVLSLEYDGEALPKEVTVTLKTSAPYVKTLAAKFILKQYDLPEYTIEDCGNYCKITVFTNDYDNALKIEWDAKKYSPDNTNPYMATWKDTSSSESIAVESNHTYELLFVKNAEIRFDTKNGTGSTIKLD